MKDLEKLIATIVGLVVVNVPIYLYYDQIQHILLEANPYHIGLAMLTLCFLGSMTPFVPYTAVILSLAAAMPQLNILEVAVWGGIGSGLGETIGWLIGRYLGGALRDSRYSGRMEAFSAIVNMRRYRWLVPIAIFLFAYTPLPDKFFFLILGAVGYSLVRAIPFSIAGKISMLYTIGLFGRFLGMVTTELPVWMPLSLAVVLVVGFTILISVIDWEEIARKLSVYPEDRVDKDLSRSQGLN
ncbi:MAG: hypothetical protein RMJ00_03495 [Nitrososphaerota archaeon]|nr:VTT domain-containing protein [Candidatus Bathyarchaeota archaeon]MCX8162684.1 VTT domain-containing protein [Candidatus Bathyarchaeota archaeon]MDW8061743.1 hypothetical protein [Nitrososphaerota archaeon]